MNKLLTKIVGAALGVAMTVGVGVAVASNNKVEPVHADSSVTFAWTSFGINGTAASKTETTSGYSVTISSVSTQGVAKSGTINNTVALPGSITNLTVNGAKTGSTKTDGTFEVFGGTAANSITNKIDTVTGLSSTASNPSVDFSGSYSFFKIVVGTARTLIFTNISVSYSVSSTYSVTYNMNCDELVSGSVPTDSHAYSSSDNTVTVAGNTGNMSRGEKYEFVGWTINKDGSGTVYGPADGQTHTLDISNNTTFYAKWNQVKYTVTYDGNGSTSGNVPANPTNYNSGTNVTVLGNTNSLAKTGYSFVQWNTASDGSGTPYNGGDVISSISEDVTLYAVWGEEDDPISGTSWSYTFSAKTFNPLNSTQKLAGQCGSTNTGLKWTISAKQSGGSNVSYSGYDSTKGQQIGSGSDSAATASISSSSFSSLSKITSVTVNTSGTSGVVASVSVKVGDKDFKNNNNTSVSISTTATNYEFTGTGAGAVSINWNQSSSKGLYIKSITVVYEIEPSVVATEISVSGSASVNGQGETSVQSTYSYDVTYQAGKTGNKANVEVSVSPAAFAEVGTISNQQFTVTFKRSTTFTITVSSTETANVSGTLDVTVTNVTLEGYIKLSSEVSLYAGAKILIVDETSEVAAGAISNSRLGDEDVTINDGVIPTSGKGDALEFTLGGTVDNWTLTSSEGLLGTKEVKKLVYDDADATTTWTITVSSAVGHEGEATIESTGDGLGKILYNADNYYFANYASAPTSANRLPQIYVKAPENSIYDMIENTMRMGDTALKGDGSGACKNSGYYLAAKAALAALSSADRAKFRDDDGGKYTAALARYNAWALACNDAAPFDGETTVVTTLSSANIVSIFNNTTNVAAIIAIVSVISLSAVAGFFLLRKRKEQ